MCSVIAGITALTGYAQYRSQQQQANAQAAMYRQQAQVAEQNAKIENRKQEQIADNYQQQQRTLRARQRLTEGQQRAQTGAAGLNFAGSAMDILSSSYDAARQDQLNLLSNQRNDNYNSRVAETNYINQANAANTAASNVTRMARRQGLGTLLGTAASVYGATYGSSTPKKQSLPFGGYPQVAQDNYINTVNQQAKYAFPTGLSYSNSLNYAGNLGNYRGTKFRKPYFDTSFTY